MPPPIVLIDSATGSDTAASGAGPSTALTGSSASTSADGLTVTLDGSPDLTNVLTDGSHVIWLNDATVNARNFAAISAKDNVAKTVTVSQAFAVSLTGKSWAIGGKRASIGSTTSRRLVEQAVSGDWMPGWRVRFASGHTETMTATLTLRRAGDTTNGPMYFEGDPAAGVKPSLTWSANVAGISVAGSGKQISNLKLRNTNATKTNSAIIFTNGVQNSIVGRCIVGESGAGWSIGISYVNNNHGHIEIIENDIGFCATGLSVSSASLIAGNYIHDLSSHGVSYGSSSGLTICVANVLASIGGDGIRTGTAITGLVAIGNTFNSITGDAINILDVTLGTEHVSIINNIISNVTGYGIDWAVTAEAAALLATSVRSNNIYNCTAGATNPAGLAMVDGTTLDPQYVSSTDFTPGNTGITTQGFPATLSASTNYLGIGAIQPVGASGGGGLLVRRAFNGGFA